MMQLAMMAATKRHCVLVADLATECLPLDKPQMMRVGGSTATNQTRLLGHEPHMLTIAKPTRRRQGQYTFVDNGAAAPLFGTWTSRWWWRGFCSLARNAQQPLLEGSLDLFSIG